MFNALPKGALMVEACIGTMALQNLKQYGCQTGNKLNEKSRELNWNSSRFFFSNKNETMFGIILTPRQSVFDTYILYTEASIG
jgi:hypothetical protein